MAMIKCFSCGKEVSDRVPKCMFCGAQIGAPGEQRWTGIGALAANGGVNEDAVGLDLTASVPGQGKTEGFIPTPVPVNSSANSFIPASIPSKGQGDSLNSSAEPTGVGRPDLIPSSAAGNGVLYMPGPVLAENGVVTYETAAGENTAGIVSESAVNREGAEVGSEKGEIPAAEEQRAFIPDAGVTTPGTSTEQGSYKAQGDFVKQGSSTAQGNPTNQGSFTTQGNSTNQGSYTAQDIPPVHGAYTAQSNSAVQGNTSAQENPLVKWFLAKPFGTRILIVVLTVLLGPPIIIGFVKGIFSSATGSRSSSRSSSYYEQEEEEEREAEAQPTAEAKPVESTKIYMPQKASAFKGESYEDVVKILEGAGFHNIKLVADPDLINGFLHDDGDVEKVSVGGYTSFSTSDSFDPDVEIVITYHTFPDSKKENASSGNEDEVQKPTATTKPTPTDKPTPTPKPTEGQRAGTQEMNNVLYDNNGIKFVLTTYEYDSFWGTHTLNFEITNNSNHEILVTGDNIASNGYQLDVFGIYKTVGPGLKAKDSIVIYDSDLKKNGLTKLEPLSFDLEIMDMETFKVIASGHIS